MGQTDPPKITCVRYFRKSIVILEKKNELCENLTDAQSPLSGSAVVEWLTLDQEAAGSSLTGVTALWSSGRPVPVSLIVDGT